MVVFTAERPSDSWIVRISWPASRQRVANECRKVWHETFLRMPVSMLVYAEQCQRRVILQTGSKRKELNGNKSCHPNSHSALGYFDAGHWVSVIMSMLKQIVLWPDNWEREWYGSRLVTRDVAYYGRKYTDESSTGRTAQCVGGNACAALENGIVLIA